jgi:hypothetical protein
MVDVTLVTHVAGGAVKLAIIVVDSGFGVVLVHYSPLIHHEARIIHGKVKIIVLVDE